MTNHMSGIQSCWQLTVLGAINNTGATNSTGQELTVQEMQVH